MNVTDGNMKVVVEVVVMVKVGVAAVMVGTVMPMHEHALSYAMALEQADAQVGTVGDASGARMP